jgi:hypothetical protein
MCLLKEFGSDKIRLDRTTKERVQTMLLVHTTVDLCDQFFENEEHGDEGFWVEDDAAQKFIVAAHSSRSSQVSINAGE